MFRRLESHFLRSAQVGKNTLVVTIFTFMLEQQLTCLKQLNNWYFQTESSAILYETVKQESDI
jgi:hypothetical protein